MTMDAARELTNKDGADAGNVVALGRSRQEHGVQGAPADAPHLDKPVGETSPSAKKVPESPARADKAKPDAPAKKKRSRPRVLLSVGLVLLLGAGGWYGYEWWTNGRFFVSTDDAYVQADVSMLGTKVSGYVSNVFAKDGDHVKAGQVLVELDSVDYRLALDAARAKRATQGATVARIDRQIESQHAEIESRQAGIVSAEAEQVRASAAFERAEALAQQSFQSKAALDQAKADRDRADAAVTSARAALTAAEADLDVIAAQKAEAEQVAKELDTAIAKAESDLAATEIRAPADGVVGNRAAQPGQYVAPGTRLMALVPMASIYVAANFKETQLAGIRPGQSAKVSVDSLDGESFTGKVESLAPASGSTFSLLPPENATGNFTKITQRVPVRVEVPADFALKDALRPGLSVVVSIDTRS
jgi:membrane fusion protein (multidrug efflux system)